MSFIPVMGIDIAVNYVESLPGDSLGEYSSDNRTINIDVKLSSEMKQSVLLHEVLHCILDLSGQSEYLSAKQEEALVIALETGLVGIMDSIYSDDCPSS